MLRYTHSAFLVCLMLLAAGCPGTIGPPPQ